MWKYTKYPFDSNFKLFDSHTGKMLFICNCDDILDVKRKARLYDSKRDGNCLLELLRKTKKKGQFFWVKYEYWNY